MDTPSCKTCEHFIQHYYLDEQYCTTVNCEHCCYPRLKHRHGYLTATVPFIF